MNQSVSINPMKINAEIIECCRFSQDLAVLSSKVITTQT